MSRAFSGKFYHTHSIRGVLLFKIKSPDRKWFTNGSFSAGRDRDLSFDDASPKIDRNYPAAKEVSAGFTYGKFIRDMKYYTERLDLLRKVNENQSSLELKEELKGINRKLVDFKGAKCFLFYYEREARDEIYDGGEGESLWRRPAEVIKAIECPVFFRKTFGVVQIAFFVKSSELKYAKLAFEESVNDFDKTLESFKFIAPFTQEIPANFSMEEQFKKVTWKWYQL